MTEPDWKPVGDSTPKVIDDLYIKIFDMEVDMDESGQDVKHRILWMIEDLYKSLHCKDT